MAAFLSGLLRNPQDEEDAYALTGAAPLVAQQPQPPPRSGGIVPPPGASRDKSPGGLLKQAANWALSPQGLLAIGTTLRAGGGDPNAFADQRAIMGRWDARRKEDETAADLALKNEAFDSSWITDDKGKRKFDNDVYMAELKKRGVKGDRAGMLKEAKDLRDTYSVVSGERGKREAVNLQDLTDRQVLDAGDPETRTVELPDGRKGVLRRVGGAPAAAAPPASAASGAPAVAASPVAAAGASVPPPPPPPDLSGPDEQQVADPNADDAAEQVWANMIHRESGGRPGVTGPMTDYGQAQGLTQMLPATAQEMATKLGVPWRPDLMTSKTPEGAAYQTKLGRAYFQQGREKYPGDLAKAASYYHGGPNERIWGPKTRAYAAGVTKGVGGPRQLAAAGPSGTDAAGRAAAAPQARNLPPPPPGWEWDQEPTGDTNAWVNLSPAEAKERGWSQGQRNRFTGEEKGTNLPAGARGGGGRLPATVLKMQGDLLKELNTASLNSRFAEQTINQIEKGDLDLGVVKNWVAGARNAVGMGDKETQRYDSFRRNLEKLRNDSLRLNKGVQTEGDSERAWNEMLTNLGDENLVKERLREIVDINEQAVALRRDILDQTRLDAGFEPFDTSKYEAKPFIHDPGGGGTKGRPPLSSFEK